MIKFKLKDQQASAMRLRTEGTPKEELEQQRYRKIPEMATFVMRSMQMKKAAKKKKIDLSVTNTKFQLAPRTSHNDKVKEVFIALDKRDEKRS